MNDRQESKLRMFRGVSGICHNNEPTYSGTPAFVNGVQLLDNSIVDIGRCAVQQQGAISGGVSKDKHVALDNLTRLSLKMANGLYVYAFDAGDATLQMKVNINKSAFYNRHENEAVVQAKKIAEEAHNHEADLLSYGIDATTIAALDAAIDTAESLLVKPQATIGERKMYTGNIKQLFAQADSVLYDRLDKLIEIYRDSAPDFYTQYKTARNIVTPTRKREVAKPPTE